jgi:hypothetical protein
VQTSISAYYYTPVHGFFVAALVGMGVCMFCLKGNTHAEDVLLNLAGAFAPVVALVPTPDPGPCGRVAGITQDRDVNVANNFTALLVVGLVVLGLAVFLALQDDAPRRVFVRYGPAALAGLATTLVFELARTFFLGNAHITAAFLMFLCILAVVWINARGFKAKPPTESARNRYPVIFAAMVLAALVSGGAKLLGWDYSLLAIEIAWILLFAIFWGIQTRELWHEGLR